MNDRQAQTWQQILWRRPLSPAEAQQLQAQTAHNPDLAEALETEAALTDLLARLPDAPVPSNFTAQVLHAIEAQTSRSAAPWLAARPWRQWLGWLAPRLAWTAVLALAAGLGWNQYHISRRAQAMAGVVPVLQATALPDPRLLQDFDAILQLSEVPSVTDLELLHALTQ